MAQDWKSFEPLLIPDIPNLQDIEVYEENGG
jgi:NADH-quinone oxidoreductase subunit F